MSKKYVFVTYDGAETDLDLCHHEGFIYGRNEIKTKFIFWEIM